MKQTVSVGKSTVREVAAETGVSIATVSRVLNNHPHVAPGTRELVQQAMRRLGERAPGRRGSGRPAPGAIYLRCPYLLSDYFGLIVTSIAETLELHDRQVVLDAGEASQRREVLPTLARRPGIAGAIIVLPLEPSQQLLDLRAADFPFVVVDPRTPMPPDVAAVSAAHFAGARNITKHLVELGHRRIGVITGPENWLVSEGRLAGHVSALADVGVLPDPGLVRSGEPTTRVGYEAACELLDLPDRPSALIGFNDKMAIGVMRATAERGLRVPDDVSVTGFDDSDLAQACVPGLTTVRQPLQEMGRIAVSLLVRLLAGHRLDALHIELATELIVRGSTGPARR